MYAIFHINTIAGASPIRHGKDQVQYPMAVDDLVPPSACVP